LPKSQSNLTAGLGATRQGSTAGTRNVTHARARTLTVSVMPSSSACWVDVGDAHSRTSHGAEGRAAPRTSAVRGR
jgi:hypothetical protein